MKHFKWGEAFQNELKFLPGISYEEEMECGYKVNTLSRMDNSKITTSANSFLGDPKVRTTQKMFCNSEHI